MTYCACCSLPTYNDQLHVSLFPCMQIHDLACDKIEWLNMEKLVASDLPHICIPTIPSYIGSIGEL